jgi:hypothetical protein
MLLTLSFFLEKMRFEAGLGAGHLEAATPDSQPERQVSVTSDQRALHSVQFSKRVSEKPAPSDDHLHHLHHLHPDADSSGIWDFLKFLTSFHWTMGWETNLQDFSVLAPPRHEAHSIATHPCLARQLVPKRVTFAPKKPQWPSSWGLVQGKFHREISG